MDDTAFEDRIRAIRAFNRFYTRHVGALNEGLLKSPYSLAEVRVLYELNYRDAPTAATLARDLGLDPAYLSRTLRRLRAEGLVEGRRSPTDGREQLLSLTAAGREAFEPLDRGSRDEVAEYLDRLSEPEQRELVAAMGRIQSILRPEPEPLAYVIRPHRPGDIGWIVHRHGALYWQEYGLDETFEGLVAGIAGEFLKQHDPRREHCWVAERDGGIVGSVFVVAADAETAKLRLLYVEPSARGLGVGRRLVDECIRFARAAGYRRLTLWTNDVLVAARRIYEAAGFRLEASEPYHGFGRDMVGETWSLEL